MVGGGGGKSLSETKKREKRKEKRKKNREKERCLPLLRRDIDCGVMCIYHCVCVGISSVDLF